MAIVLGSTGWAQVTQRMSIAADGTQGDGESAYPSLSADGRVVAFRCMATNLVPGDTNGVNDACIREWNGNLTELASVDTNEILADGYSEPPRLSGDGRYVVFESEATNLSPGDTNGKRDIFIRDRTNGTTARVSLGSAGAQATDHCIDPAISADARYVAFASAASNLVSGDTNGTSDVFVRDLLSGVTERVSVSTTGAQASGSSTQPSISGDGRYVVFTSAATNLVAGDTNGVVDIFLRDRVGGSTQRISVSVAGVEGNGGSELPTISADGMSVAFASVASNLISWDTNGFRDIYYRAWQNNYNELVSASTNSALGNAASNFAEISADGRFVAFQSAATNLVAGDTNGATDVFVRNRSVGTTERASLSSSGAEANNSSDGAAISADGRFVAFRSYASNLVAGDTNTVADVFLRDRYAASFTSLCEPGVDGVMACPCSNPPAISGRGCNNSSSTGGAVLTASGIAYLSMDSLVFTTFGEKPTALSIVLQGNALIAAGAVYGQGVRCVGGSLKRLYTLNASLGSISVPNFGAGERTVSAMSAVKGDTIQPGQSRWYLVYYRDGQILGGCPATSTFNTTQTGRVDWML
jgi:Tol biopolymer transport system component